MAFKGLVARPRLVVHLVLLFALIGGLAIYDLYRPQSQIRPRTEVPAEVPSKAPSAPNACENVYPAICGKPGTTNDPTGHVRPEVMGELRALRVYEEIVRSNPDWTPDEVDEALVKKLYTPDRRARFTRAFFWVKASIRTLIRSQPETVFTLDEKTRIDRRLRRIRLDLPPPASTYADEPDLFTRNDVFYERSVIDPVDTLSVPPGSAKQAAAAPTITTPAIPTPSRPLRNQPTVQDIRIRVGGAFLLTIKSWFNIIFTLAHEVAHSIDPCELASEKAPPPAGYTRLEACFLENRVVLNRKNREKCGANDQLSESFADWIAVQITAQALKEFSSEFRGEPLTSALFNSVRDLCDIPGHSASAPNVTIYPNPQIRVGKIFGKNPAIRELLGCEPEPVTLDYCTFEWRKP